MDRTLPEAVFARLRDLLAADPDVEVAACFGSAALGRLRPDSDVDIYVKLRRGASWPVRRELELAADSSEVAGREIDLVVEDEERTSVILRLEVARHGRLLWEARPGAWVELRARAMLAHADLEPWMRRCGEGVRRALAARRERLATEPVVCPETSPIGWLADEPEVADELDKLMAEARVCGRARRPDDD